MEDRKHHCCTCKATFLVLSSSSFNLNPDKISFVVHVLSVEERMNVSTYVDDDPTGTLRLSWINNQNTLNIAYVTPSSCLHSLLHCLSPFHLYRPESYIRVTGDIKDEGSEKFIDILNIRPLTHWQEILFYVFDVLSYKFSLDESFECSSPTISPYDINFTVQHPSTFSSSEQAVFPPLSRRILHFVNSQPMEHQQSHVELNQTFSYARSSFSYTLRQTPSLSVKPSTGYLKMMSSCALPFQIVSLNLRSLATVLKSVQWQ